MSAAREESLIFIVSQPRSGSSLLQQLLVNHPKITGVPESWFLLRAFSAYGFDEIESPFVQRHARVNFENFLAALPDGRARYEKLFRDFILGTYGLAADPGCRYFVDKTPRYYHVTEQIRRFLPAARQLVLVRHPLAVFASILAYNFEGDLDRMTAAPGRQGDLYLAPQVLARLSRGEPGQTQCRVRYEELVTDTQNVLAGIQDFLGLSSGFNPVYKVDAAFRDGVGIDAKSVQRHDRPTAGYLEAWKQSLDSGAKVQAARRYLKRLGADLLADLGYDLERSQQELDQHLASLPLRQRLFG